MAPFATTQSWTAKTKRSKGFSTAPASSDDTAQIPDDTVRGVKRFT